MSGWIFWLIIASLCAICGLMLKGYQLTLPALFVIIFGFVYLKLSIDGNKVYLRNISSDFRKKLNLIDTIIQDLTKAFKSDDELTRLQVEINADLDRMAKKMISIENDLNHTRRTFSAAFASLDDRLRILEPKSKEIELSPDGFEP